MERHAMDSGQGSFNRRQDADDLTNYVNNGWLSSNEFDGPTFLWNHMIREASRSRIHGAYRGTH